MMGISLRDPKTAAVPKMVQANEKNIVNQEFGQMLIM